MPDESSPPGPDAPVILIIDDDPLIAVLMRRALQGRSHSLATAETGAAGVVAAEQHKPDLIVLDNVLPDRMGVEVLTELLGRDASVPVLFITARGSGATAIEAMKLGAFDYLPKPLDPGRLRTQVECALELRRLQQATPPRAGGASDAAVAEAEGVPAGAGPLLGQCPAMQEVFKAIGRVATQEVAVLIRGEHGAGKESVAEQIHRHGPSADGPYVKLSCRGVDASRLESELFGGSTDSGGPAPGRLDDAAGGMLVLEEVGALSLSLQGKLLRAVRDGVFESIGVAGVKPVRCRIVAITSEDLETKSREGGFRSDLYYTLSSFVVTLPPLRQRHGDLPLLIEQLLDKLAPIAASFGVARPTVSDEAMQVLCAHPWPGNIDELESVLKRALVEQRGNVLLAGDLGRAIGGESVVTPADAARSGKHTVDWSAFSRLRIEAGADTLHADAVAETERRVFDCVLRHTGGNQAHAARILGITRASLRKKLRMYGMVAKPTDE